MYQDEKLWKRVRYRILEKGESIRHVSETTSIHRVTIRKILKHEHPLPHKRKRTELFFQQPAVEKPARIFAREKIRHQWMEWLYHIERHSKGVQSDGPIPPELLKHLSPSPHNPRKRILSILAKQEGFSIRAIGENLGISRNTVNGYLADFEAEGGRRLHPPKQRQKLSDDPALKAVVLALLHEPPSLSGHNRTTWRVIDLQNTLTAKGFTVGQAVLRAVIRKTGFRWKVARVVLTSCDPEYREKYAAYSNHLILIAE